MSNDISSMFENKKRLEFIRSRKGLQFSRRQVSQKSFFQPSYSGATKKNNKFELRKIRKVMTCFFPNNTHSFVWESSLWKLECPKDPVSDGDDGYVMVTKPSA